MPADTANPRPTGRDLVAEKEAFEERLAICMADGIPEAEALRIAEGQLWTMIRKADHE